MNRKKRKKKQNAIETAITPFHINLFIKDTQTWAFKIIFFILIVNI